MAISGPKGGLCFTSALPPKADILGGCDERLLMTLSGRRTDQSVSMGREASEAHSLMELS